MKTQRFLSLIGIIVALALPAIAATPTDNWADSCASCHGEDGAAQTKVGKKLKLKDYTDAASLAEFSDEQLAKITAEGVVIDGKEKMKPFADVLTADEIKDLVKLIRDFAKK